VQLRTEIEYAEPSNALVRLTLIGSLEGFEKLESAIRASNIPLYEVDTLIYQLRDASMTLRSRTTVSGGPPRRMVEGDL
jgi:hypothetical protein